MVKVHEQATPVGSLADYKVPISDGTDGETPAAKIKELFQSLSQADKRGTLIQLGSVVNSFGGLPQASSQYLGTEQANWLTGQKFLCIQNVFKSSRSEGTWTDVTRDDLIIQTGQPANERNHYWIDNFHWTVHEDAIVDNAPLTYGWVQDNFSDALTDSAETGRTTIHWMGEYASDEAALDDIHNLATATTYFYGRLTDGTVRRLSAISFVAAGNIRVNFAWIATTPPIRFQIARLHLPELDQDGLDDNLVVLGPEGDLYGVKLVKHQMTPSTFTAEDFSQTGYLGEHPSTYAATNRPDSSDVTNRRYWFDEEAEVWMRAYQLGADEDGPTYRWLASVAPFSVQPFRGSFDNGAEAAAHLESDADFFYDRTLGKVRDVLTFVAGTTAHSSRAWNRSNRTDAEIWRVFLDYVQDATDDEIEAVREALGLDSFLEFIQESTSDEVEEIKSELGITEDDSSAAYILADDFAIDFTSASTGRPGVDIINFNRALDADDDLKWFQFSVRQKATSNTAAATKQRASSIPILAKYVRDLVNTRVAYPASTSTEINDENFVALGCQRNEGNGPAIIWKMYYTGSNITTLAANISGSSTEFAVADASALSIGDEIILEGESGIAITGIAGNTLTVTRPTGSVGHSSGKRVQKDDGKGFFFIRTHSAQEDVKDMEIILVGVGAAAEDEAAGQMAPGGSNRGMRAVAGNLLSDANNVDWQWYDTGIAKDGTGGWDEVENTVVIQVDQLPEAGLGRSRAMSGPMRKADFEGLRPPDETNGELPGDAHSENSAGRVNMRLRSPAGGSGSDLLIGLRDNGNIIIAQESAGHFVHVQVFSMEFGEEEEAEGVSAYGEDHWQFMWWQRAETAPDVVQTAWSPGFASDLDLASWEPSRTLADTNGNSAHPIWIMTGSADRADDGTITQVDNEVYREFGAEYSDTNSAATGDLAYDEDVHRFVRFILSDGTYTQWIAMTDTMGLPDWVEIYNAYIYDQGSLGDGTRAKSFSSRDISVYKELLVTIQPFNSWSSGSPIRFNTKHEEIIDKLESDWPVTHADTDIEALGVTFVLNYDDIEGLSIGIDDDFSPGTNTYRNLSFTVENATYLWRQFTCNFKLIHSASVGEVPESAHLTGIRFFNLPRLWNKFHFKLYGR